MLRDQVIFFYKLAQAGIDAYFRRIEFYDEEQERVLVFLTSHSDWRQSFFPVVLPHLEMLPKISLKNVTERLLMFCI